MDTLTASMLRIGDLVRDTAIRFRCPRYGPVVQKRLAGLTVRWPDGREQRFAFCDLNQPRYKAIFKRGYANKLRRKAERVIQ